MKTSRHPTADRMLLVIVPFLMGLFLGGGVVLVLWRIGERYIQRDPEYMGVCLAFRLAIFVGLGLPLVVGMLYSSFCHWFMLSEYHISELEVETRSLILRRNVRMRFDEVVSVQIVSVVPLCCNKASAYGRKLSTADGRSMLLSVVFPLWPEMLRRCPNAAIEPEVTADLRG